MSSSVGPSRVALEVFRTFLLALSLFGGVALAARSQELGVVVNGVALNAQTLHELQHFAQVVIPPGRYWYDPISGAYGVEGGPVLGQTLPMMNLGGPLRPDASNGTSGVFVNGRQLTLGETSYLETICQTPVFPGRYWVNAAGLGGYEGGPAAFNLALCGSGGGGGGGRGSSTKTWCDPNGACTSTGVLGTITTTP